VERRYELEIMRRSLAMLTPGVRALTHEEALQLVEVADVQTSSTGFARVCEVSSRINRARRRSSRGAWQRENQHSPQVTIGDR
jgi:hypothetical protein